MPGLFEDFNPIQRVGTNQYGPSVGSSLQGSLISFHYPKSYAIHPNIIHDPYPMIIVAAPPNQKKWKVDLSKYVFGVNLHYLTFPYIKRLLTTYAGKSFSYYHIRNDRYLSSAYRMYVRVGLQQPKRLDTDWLLGVLQSVRSFGPGELEQIRSNIQKQIQQRLQAKANELTSYEQWRKQLTQSQQRQLRGKGLEGQRMLLGGVDRDLINQPPENHPFIPLPDENLNIENDISE